MKSMALLFVSIAFFLFNRCGAFPLAACLHKMDVSICNDDVIVDIMKLSCRIALYIDVNH